MPGNRAGMPALGAHAAVHEVVACDRRAPNPGIAVVGFYAPALAHSALPGQFVMAVTPSGERVATALGIYEAQDERISLMLAVVGARTQELAMLEPGARVALVGPLGNGFDLDALGDDVALVAGGVGIASLLLPAIRLRERGARVQLYYGARTAGALVDAERFTSIGASVSVATDDGSRGHHGYVTDLLAREWRAHESIAACGPSPMLRAIGRFAAARGVRAALSLEETFACGVGACWGCVVPLDRASAQAPAFPQPAPGERREYVHARICREGPVFWSDELRW